jgi:putative hydrolase of the HAD superfamily
MTVTLGFDGDDTLWPNEVKFINVKAYVQEVLAAYPRHDDFEARLLATEKKNLKLFGYGEKGFVLSIIETAIDLTDGAVTTADIKRILDIGLEMFDMRIQTYPQVFDTLRALHGDFNLMLVTKGDLFEQEAKVAQSGLSGYFGSVHIVSEKEPSAYRSLLAERGIDPEDFVMIGNSLRSDIWPVLELGGRAVYIPHHQTWAHENDVAAQGDGSSWADKYRTVADISKVPDALADLGLRQLNSD